MKKVLVILFLQTLIVVGCKKEEIKPCNCGIVEKSEIVFNNIIREIQVRNYCTGNGYTFLVSDTLNINDEYCREDEFTW
jgi:hypothetical protein